MTPKQLQLQQLRRLCDAQGGHEVVAALAEANPAYLWQLLNGTRLQSGESRGMGHALAKKLDAAFPGWFNAATDPPSKLNAALTVLGTHLSTLEPPLREAVAANLAAWARDGGAKHWSVAVETLLLRKQ